ncbi:MAG: hypothetical protein U5N56_10000 [Candidatus Marinimicrobia bacterium]|nr:hypothetical protein [Candidatus Neomarinimicrobiota bacterium]
MRTPLEEAKRRRLRVSLYYANTMQFIMRLLMGVGIYILFRIAVYAFLMNEYGLPFYLSRAPYELIVLVFTAVLLLFILWAKGTRLHLLATLWMPAAACFVIVDLIKLLAGIARDNILSSVFGILPYVLPLSIFIIIWLLDLRSRRLRLIISVILIFFCAFWISDMPVTLRQVRELHRVTDNYQEFYRELRAEHVVDAGMIPERAEDGPVYGYWTLKPVNPKDYRFHGTEREIKELAYVRKLDIEIPGRYEKLPYSGQELHFESLDNIEHHYFYKYSVRRHIVIQNFYFSGDTFYRAVYVNGDKVFLDNVAVRKK